MPDPASRSSPVLARTAPLRIRGSNYPEHFSSSMAGREKRPLGDLFGIANFGVNLTSLMPATVSALLHRHSRQDEWIYVLQGSLVLVLETGEEMLEEGMCAGYRAHGPAHQLANRSNTISTYLEVGDRMTDDIVSYPNDDLMGAPDASGNWRFRHKNGQSY